MLPSGLTSLLIPSYAGPRAILRSRPRTEAAEEAAADAREAENSQCDLLSLPDLVLLLVASYVPSRNLGRMELACRRLRRMAGEVTWSTRYRREFQVPPPLKTLPAKQQFIIQQNFLHSRRRLKQRYFFLDPVGTNFCANQEYIFVADAEHINLLNRYV